MKVEILTILPGVLHSYLQEGVVGRAIRDGVIGVNVINVRNYCDNKHMMTDDAPYGGGPGQVMMIEPLVNAVKSVKEHKKRRIIFLTPQGKPFTSEKAKELAEYDQLVLVCGRYEGIDQRFRDKYVDEEISVGDYVLSGGELAALIVLDASARFVPGVLGNNESAENDSFSNDLLEHPQYTRPQVFEGMKVPDILLSGNHKKIEEWRLNKSIERTKAVRPDLIEKNGEKSIKDMPKKSKKLD